MAIANRVNSTIEPNITQDSLVTAIKSAFYDLVADTWDEFDSGTDKILVYAIYTYYDVTYGISYLRIRVASNLVISCQLWGTWNYEAHTGGFGSGETIYPALSSSVAIDTTSLVLEYEFRSFLLRQGNIFIPLGYLNPAVKPDWWNPNSFNYCFITTSGSFNIWRTTGKQPFSSTDHDCFIGSPRLAGANPITNKRDILQGICLFATSNQGISGRTSDDLVIVAATGSARYDIIRTPDNREYLILNPAAGGFAVRIA